jgi:uncharacterized SAM-binding protein YcdF (DUF218 family)
LIAKESIERDMLKLPKWVIASTVVFFVVLVAFIFRAPLLEKIGSNLVYQTELVPSDAIVVLAGSHTGNRMEEAARIYNKGMGKVIVFTGYTYYPGMNSNVGMKKYAIKLGVPEENIFTEMGTGEDSTWGEALSNLRQLQHLKAKSFILVTSSYHTRRSYSVYERAIKKLNMDIDIRVQPAPDRRVPIPGWWKVRTGKKEIFYEYIKTLYYSIAY